MKEILRILMRDTKKNYMRIRCAVEEIETRWIEYKTNVTMLDNVIERRTMIDSIF